MGMIWANVVKFLTKCWENPKKRKKKKKSRKLGIFWGSSGKIFIKCSEK